MSTENQEPPVNIVDGGAPTAQEQLFASQLEGLGDDPKEEPAAPAAAPAADPAAADPAAVVADPATAAAPAPAPADPAAVVADPVAQPPAPPAPAPVAVTMAKPVPPKDFDAEYIALQAKYDSGDLDGPAFQAAQRDLSKEEGKFTARVTIWEEHQQGAALQATQDFNQTALAWEEANKDFMANPLRAQQMSQAIQLIDKQTGYSLSPSDLLKQAADASFEAFGWTPKVAVTTPAVDTAAALAAATAARKPANVPATLATADAAAPIEAARNTTFDELDAKGISELEDAIARMPAAAREAYLSSSPGSKSTLRSGGSDTE